MIALPHHFCADGDRRFSCADRFSAQTEKIRRRRLAETAFFEKLFSSPLPKGERRIPPLADFFLRERKKIPSPVRTCCAETEKSVPAGRLPYHRQNRICLNGKLY